jgi:hypothetical protein
LQDGKIIDIQDFGSEKPAVALMHLRTMFG